MAEGRPLVTVLLVAVIATVAAVLVTSSWEFSRDITALQKPATWQIITRASVTSEPENSNRQLNT
jgi:hypothetical protein